MDLENNCFFLFVCQIRLPISILQTNVYKSDWEISESNMNTQMYKTEYVSN
jgi:hypothetical protein